MDLLSYVATAFILIIPMPLGPIGDYCSYRDHTIEYSRQLPKNFKKAHKYSINIEDAACLGEWRKDTFKASVRLEHAPAGLKLCVRMKPAQDKLDCSKTFYEYVGSWGSTDTQDVEISILWHPKADLVSGIYKLVVSAL